MRTILNKIINFGFLYYIIGILGRIGIFRVLRVLIINNIHLHFPLAREWN